MVEGSTTNLGTTHHKS